MVIAAQLVAAQGLRIPRICYIFLQVLSKSILWVMRNFANTPSTDTDLTTLWFVKIKLLGMQMTLYISCIETLYHRSNDNLIF